MACTSLDRTSCYTFLQYTCAPSCILLIGQGAHGAYPKIASTGQRSGPQVSSGVTPGSLWHDLGSTRVLQVPAGDTYWPWEYTLLWGGYLPLLQCHLPTLLSLRLQNLCRDSMCILTLPQLSSGPSPPFDLSASLQKELFIAKMMQNL